MIVFNTPHNKMFNYIINRFLKLEVFSDDNELDNKIEELMPKYLRREQYRKCKQTFEELYQMTQDKFNHEMTAFHEFVLYKFLEYIEEIQEEDESINLLFFDDKARNLIEQAKQDDLQDLEYEDLFEVETEDNQYYDVSYYYDDLFDDTDFLMIPYLYNECSLGCVDLEEYFGIDIDFYFELLPLDIRKKYKNKYIRLGTGVRNFILFTRDKINYGSLYKIFWNGKKHIFENEIRTILDNLMTFYFKKNDDEILWSSFVENDTIRFQICKRFHEEKKVLFQIQCANKDIFVEGYEKQLLNYSEKYDTAYYVVICFTDEEYEHIEDFIKKYVYTDKITLYINIYIFDARYKASASKL